MIKPRLCNREYINQWPVDSLNLPLRVLNAAKKLKIKSVRNLREVPGNRDKQFTGMGLMALDAIDKFFVLCEKLENGTISFENLNQLLKFFLEEREYQNIIDRYGLRSIESNKDGKYETLQQIADKYNITRERVRQVTDRGLSKLKSAPVQTCLHELVKFFKDYVNSCDGISESKAISKLRNEELLGTLNPHGVLLMLCDCNKAIRFHNGFFTTLRTKTIIDIENSALEFIAKHNHPVTLTELLSTITLPPEIKKEEASKIIHPIIANTPRICATRDNHFFSSKKAASVIIAEIIKTLDQPQHFENVMNQFNRRMLPGSRKGAGYILGILTKSPLFSKEASGIYKIKE